MPVTCVFNTEEQSAKHREKNESFINCDTIAIHLWRLLCKTLFGILCAAVLNEVK